MMIGQINGLSSFIRKDRWQESSKSSIIHFSVTEGISPVSTNNFSRIFYNPYTIFLLFIIDYVFDSVLTTRYRKTTSSLSKNTRLCYYTSVRFTQGKNTYARSFKRVLFANVLSYDLFPRPPRWRWWLV